MCVRARVRACVCVCVSVKDERQCVCVCVCVTMQKVPDKWHARQTIPAILQVSSSKHNAKKITTRVRGPFHQSITAILTGEKREEKQFTIPTHVAVYLFRDLDRDRSLRTLRMTVGHRASTESKEEKKEGK